MADVEHRKSKATDPPKCKTCGIAHRGTCADHAAQGAISMQASSAGGAAITTSYRRAPEGDRVPKAGNITRSPSTSMRREPAVQPIGKDRRAIVNAISEKDLDAAIERAFPTPDQAALADDAVSRAPKASEATSREGRAHQAPGLGVASARASSTKATKPKRLKAARAAMTEAEKAKRGRPKTVEDRKKYKAEKEAERRARKRAEKGKTE